jgi:cap1 methyltransferase
MNDRRKELKCTREDIIEVVPLEILQSDKVFMEYVIKSNNGIGGKQISSLMQIVACVKNWSLRDERQSDIKKECLKLWKIEDTERKTHTTVLGITLNKYWKKLMTKFEIHGDVFTPKTLTASNLPPDVYSWRWYYMCGSRYLIAGRGWTDCKGWNQRGAVNFSPIPNVANLELPPSTILDVDVCELFDSDDMKRYVVEVIDAIAIDGKFVGNIPFPQRRSLIVKLCEALNRPGRTHMRLKKTHKLIEIEAILSSLKDISEIAVPRIVSYEEGGSYTQPRGVVLFKTIKINIAVIRQGTRVVELYGI